METLVVAVLLWIRIPAAASPTQALFEPQSVDGLRYIPRWFVHFASFCNILHASAPFIITQIVECITLNWIPQRSPQSSGLLEQKPRWLAGLLYQRIWGLQDPASKFQEHSHNMGPHYTTLRLWLPGAALDNCLQATMMMNFYELCALKFHELGMAQKHSKLCWPPIGRMPWPNCVAG